MFIDDIKYIYVNGYGVPNDPLNDHNMHAYLMQVCRCIHAYGAKSTKLYLAGGFTNRTDLSEARAMLMWLKHNGSISGAEINLLEATTTARENMKYFRSLVGDVPVIILCEYSRRPTMQFFADMLFSVNDVRGVPFDKRSMSLAHRLKQWTTRLWLEKLAWHSSFFDALNRRLRARHVAQARLQTKGR